MYIYIIVIDIVLYFPCGLDLHTVSERLKSDYYSCCRLFIADMLRIFRNCRTFNDKPSDYFKFANVVERFFMTKMKEVGAMVDIT